MNATAPALPEIPDEDPSATLAARSLHEAALLFASLDWKIFPVASGAKDAMRIGDQVRATSDYRMVDELWSRSHRGANIGVATGRSNGFFVVDIGQQDEDPDMNGFLSLEKRIAEHGAMPQTLTGQSPGGSLHLYFKMPDNFDFGCSASAIGGGIDVRASGGYIVAPPSLRPDGNYTWSEGHRPGETPIAEAPEWLIAAIRQNEALRREGNHDPLLTERLVRIQANPKFRERLVGYARRVLDCEIQNVRYADEEGKNTALFGAAFSIAQLVATGILDETSSQKSLIAAAMERGMTEHDARDCVARAFARGLAFPRSNQTAPSTKRPMMTLDQAKTKLADLPTIAGNEPSVVYQAEYIRALVALRHHEMAAYVRLRDELCKQGLSKRELDRTVNTVRKDEESPEDANDRQGREVTKSATRFHFLGHNRGVFYYLTTHARQVVALRADQHTKANMLQLAPLEWWKANFPASEDDD